MASYKTGFGYDVHRFASGRKLMLGGVHVPHEQGLAGHSDADVLMHAIADALLGAAGKGDIGEHFPDTDEQYRGLAGMDLLRRVGALVAESGYTIGNVDAMILAEAPKLSPFKAQMCANIAAALSVGDDVVNVKAGTNEGMGFVGRGEGLAAYAVVLLVKVNER